uniref:DNA-directed RNA polymerases I and III subunit RPAC2 n=1 Tax=Eptatretus burgeri TaxID=7764 RepID=A0A8C4QQA3_EPTBU
MATLQCTTLFPLFFQLQAEGVDETCVTFVLHEQDHTLGNALRYMIMKNPEVVFCGYSITHPSEDKINLRIQTKGVPAIDSFRRGLCELTTVCEHVLATFETENYIFSRPEAIGILHHGNLIGTNTVWNQSVLTRTCQENHEK